MATITIEVEQLKDLLRETVDEALEGRFNDVLKDVSWRMRQLYGKDSGIPAEGLNLATHILTGYTISANTPTSGSIAWSDLHVVYKGTDYGPFAGNTALTYVWFDEDHPSQKIQMSNTKPTLGPDDAILFVNNGGTPVEVLKSQLQHGALLIDGTVNTSEIADSAIVANKILNGAISESKLGSNAVTAAKIASGAVENSKLANNAVDANKLANGAVTETKIDSNAVTSGKIATGAVESTKLADSAVTDAKLANNAVTTSKIANSAVDSNKLANSAVTAGKIADGAVGGAKITPGGIDTTKLNLFSHLLH